MKRIPSMQSLSIFLAALAPLGCSADATGPARPAPGSPPVVAAAPSPASAPQAPRPVASVYNVPVDGLPSVGRADALVTIVEFTDYQCPYCQQADATLAKVRAAYGDEVRLVVAESPLPIHDRARPAALAALAADDEGKFAALHQNLFGLKGALSDASMRDAEMASGLDPSRLDLEHAAPRLARSQALAKQLGVHGTPTFFIDGRHVVGAQPFDTFRAVIDERLAAAKTLVASGTARRDVYTAMTSSGARAVAAAKDDEECAGDCGGEGAGGEGCDGDKDKDAVHDDTIQSIPTDGDPSRGPATAPIQLVFFGDFQCPYCERAQATLHALEAAHPGEVRVVFKSFPLPIHDAARLESIAATAAGNQGHFWEFHDRLYAAGSGGVGRDGLVKIARDLGLDAARFTRDLDDPSVAARVDADIADAKRAGVQGTPTSFVNGRRVIGAQPVEAFERAIAKGRR